MLNRRCVWLWIFVLQKEFATPPNVAFEIIGNGDANHSPPLENLPREVQLAGGTIFSNAKGTNLSSCKEMRSQHPNKTLLLSAGTRAIAEFCDIPRKEIWHTVRRPFPLPRILDRAHLLVDCFGRT